MAKFLGLPVPARFLAAGAGDEKMHAQVAGSIAKWVRPRQCQLIIDGGCNQNCAHCCLGQSRVKTPTNRDQVTQVGQSLRRQGFALSVYPAEPLLNEHIFHAFGDWYSPGASEFLTNGTAPLARLPPADLVTLLREHNIPEIWVSLHGASAQSHEDLTRTPGCFDTAIKFIQKMARASETGGIACSLMVCVHKENVRDLPAITDFAIQHHIHKIYIGRMVVPYHGAVPPKLIMNRQASCDALVEINRLRLLHQKRLRILVGQSWGVNFHNPGVFRFLATTQIPFCFACAPRITVHPGRRKVYPCHTMVGCPEMEMGRIEGPECRMELNSLGRQLSTWHQEWQEKARGGCAVGTCPYSEICHGGCRGTAMAPVIKQGGTPDWFVEFPDCITTLLEEMA